MKKIYTFILLTTFVLGGSAQVEKYSDSSIDPTVRNNGPVKTHYNFPYQVQKPGQPALPTIQGCDTLGTRWAGGNNHNGNMFDLVNTSTVNIQIISFDQCFATLQADSFEVYYKSGTFVGSETTSAAWALAGRCYMAPAASLTPIPVPVTLSLTIPPGATYGFYLTNVLAGSNNAYTNGTAQGNVLKTKDGLQFLEGNGGGYPFAVTFSPRIWNGIIHYCTPLISTGINSLSTSQSVSDVYPNPMNNQANISISNSVNVKNAGLKIYDMSGRVVYTMSNINENSFSLNHNLTPGLYVVQVENENTIVLNKKVSVQ